MYSAGTAPVVMFALGDPTYFPREGFQAAVRSHIAQHSVSTMPLGFLRVHRPQWWLYTSSPWMESFPSLTPWSVLLQHAGVGTYTGPSA